MGEDHLKDNSEIKSIMKRSTRFISLRGLSGILVGIYALIGAGLAIYLTDNYLNSQEMVSFLPISYLEYLLLGIALLVLFLSILTAYRLSSKKAKKNGEKMWDGNSRRLLINFLIPLVTGGLFCIVLYQYGRIRLIAPSMLIFYGLACLNVIKYTLGDIRYLGVFNIVIGLVAIQFSEFGLYFWALGFGIMHIVYGVMMYSKYDKNKV